MRIHSIGLNGDYEFPDHISLFFLNVNNLSRRIVGTELFAPSVVVLSAVGAVLEPPLQTD